MALLAELFPSRSIPFQRVKDACKQRALSEHQELANAPAGEAIARRHSSMSEPSGAVKVVPTVRDYRLFNKEGVHASDFPHFSESLEGNGASNE